MNEARRDAKEFFEIYGHITAPLCTLAAVIVSFIINVYLMPIIGAWTVITLALSLIGFIFFFAWIAIALGGYFYGKEERLRQRKIAEENKVLRLQNERATRIVEVNAFVKEIRQ